MRFACQILVIMMSALMSITIFGGSINNQKSSIILNSKPHDNVPLVDNIVKCQLKNNTIYADPYERYVNVDMSFSSGLGNILFPFATAHDIALNHNKTFLKTRVQNTILDWFSFDIDCKEFFLDQFNPAGELFNVGDNGNQFRYTSLEISPALNYKVHGALQSYKYFNSVRGRLFMHNGLNLRPPIAMAAKEFMQEFKNNVGSSSEIVCAHVRLGDKLSNFRKLDSKRKELGVPWVADERYLKLAMNWFDDKMSKKNVYLVFTDNIDLIKEWNISQYSNQSIIYATDYLPRNNQKSLIEFEILLNHCDHLLLTSGTIGWWAGWKSKGFVLSSELQYIRDNKNEWDVATQVDYFPPNFHLIYPCPDSIDHYCGIKKPNYFTWNYWKDGLH